MVVLLRDITIVILSWVTVVTLRSGARELQVPQIDRHLLLRYLLVALFLWLCRFISLKLDMDFVDDFLWIIVVIFIIIHNLSFT